MLKKYTLLLLGVVLVFCACSCQKAEQVEENNIFKEKAKVFAERSKKYYEQAVESYKKALESGDDPEDIYYKLGSLYYDHGQYEKAADALRKTNSDFAKKLLAICFYKAGNNTDALSIFEKFEQDDDSEYLYYHGLTCEEHNLHTKALELYERITAEPFASKAQQRINDINALKEKITLEGLDSKIRDLILSAPSQEDFPQAGAVILLAEESIEVREDHSVYSEEHYLIKILNERGKRLGEIQVPYDSTYGKVEIEFARTIKPDGEVVSVGSKHIRDVSRYLNFPLYSNARVKIISMPEVTVGAVLEYKVKTFENKMVANDKLGASYFVQSAEPIQNAQFQISLPKGQELQTRIINQELNQQNFDFEPKITQGEKTTTYSWVFQNVDQIIPEPLMPPFSESAAAILMTTFKSWDEIYTWWWDLAKDKIKANEDIKEKVAELTKGLETPKEKAKAIYTFCARDIRYVGIEYGQAGYEPHQAAEIFSNKYGDCKDQAILLIAMLREAGIASYPVLIGTRDVPSLAEEFPSLLFNHCIAVAQIDGEYIFLDPTGEVVLFGDLPRGDQGRDVFVCFENEGRILTVPKFSYSHNKIEKSMRLVFDEKEKVSGSRRVNTTGFFDQMQRGWLRYTMPILVKESLQEKIQGIVPGSVLISYDVENLGEMKNDIILSYLFSGSDFLLRAGKSIRVIPQLTKIDLEIVSKPSRVYAIDLIVPQQEENIFEIVLPSNYRIKSLPDSVISETPWYRYENIYQKENNKIIFKESNIVKIDRIDPSDYVSYKESLEDLSTKVRQSIVLEK
ncbi:MAG: DUF3857 domain-containing protein [Candidatus Omnitrophica bacterium]|nr:DUF3857 domain-containing protein [Candidatus Omnitrophota bacterium]